MRDAVAAPGPRDLYPGPLVGAQLVPAGRGKRFPGNGRRHIASREVADRPGRIEPRIPKRRRHRYPLMQEPRGELKAELENMQPTSIIDVMGRQCHSFVVPFSVPRFAAHWRRQ